MPVRYRIVVQGRLDGLWLALGGMSIRVERKETPAPVSTLSGVVADQAALQGLLRRLYVMGFPLLSVTCMGPQSASPSQAQQADVS